jgi:hypothetical protein
MSQNVDDSTLDAAAEDVAVEEDAVETEEIDEETDEQEVESEDEVEETDKEDTAELEAHKERSRLGRRLSAMEERMDAFLNKAEQLVTPKEELFDEEIDPDMPVTLKEVEDYMAKKERTNTETRLKYENSYVKSVANLSSGEDPDFADKVIAEMETNFNSEYSKDGSRDAEVNWLKASNAVLKAGTKKSNPLKGKKPKAPLGVGGSDTNASRGYVRPKLDAATEDLISRSNFTEEQIKEALTSTKLYTAGERNAKNV